MWKEADVEGALLQRHEPVRAEARKAGPEILEGAEMPLRPGFLPGSAQPGLRPQLCVCDPFGEQPL